MTNHPNRATKISLAYLRCKDARAALCNIGAQCMEVTEDKAGILWERWIIRTENNPDLQFVNVIIFSTPSWSDVFVPLTNDKTILATVDAIRRLAA